MPHEISWRAIDLVVFDMDGTLYDAQPLRRAMLGQLLAHAWQARSLRTLRVLRTFRQVREALGETGADDFLVWQYRQTAKVHGLDDAEVERLVHDWMHTRPLALLPRCRTPQLPVLLERLHALGKRIAVLSDYPAQAKLQALGLMAGQVLCAGEPGMARLKPDPGGLLTVLARSGVPAERALVIGDRADRDGLMAQRAGVACLIRSRRDVPGFTTFAAYDDPIFKPLFEQP